MRGFHRGTRSEGVIIDDADVDPDELDGNDDNVVLRWTTLVGTMDKAHLLNIRPGETVVRPDEAGRRLEIVEISIDGSAELRRLDDWPLRRMSKAAIDRGDGDKVLADWYGTVLEVLDKTMIARVASADDPMTEEVLELPLSTPAQELARHVDVWPGRRFRWLERSIGAGSSVIALHLEPIPNPAEYDDDDDVIDFVERSLKAHDALDDGDSGSSLA